MLMISLCGRRDYWLRSNFAIKWIHEKGKANKYVVVLQGALLADVYLRRIERPAFALGCPYAIHEYRNQWAAVSHHPEDLSREMRPSKRNTEGNRGDVLAQRAVFHKRFND
jgi:hypothetical protein